MSGIAAGFGRPLIGEIEAMMARIPHRGRYLSGTFAHSKLAMGQNYLRADTRGGADQRSVPVSLAEEPGLKICYDGQIGNIAHLAAAAGVEAGPFREERTLLELFRRERSRLLQRLDDAIFAFVISDGEDFLAARDLLGIKTLFYGREGDTIYLSSEVKSLLSVTEHVVEFPPGHFMDASGKLTRFATLPAAPPRIPAPDVDEAIETVRDIVRRSVEARLDPAVANACLLSGGVDSSVITYLVSEKLKRDQGPGARLPTFAFGLGGSEDIPKARLLAEQVGADHQELIVDLDRAIEVLPEVIYYLESFDPSLVRSSVANYLMSQAAAAAGVETLFSGEGGDELFCGYAHMKDLPEDELFAGQIEVLEALQNNAALRLDRMNLAHSVRVVAPFVSGELLRYVLALPPQYKLRREDGTTVEKWILRKAFEPYLPAEITHRLKQEFSQGSGVADLLPARLAEAVSDRQLEVAQAKYPFLRTKEELYYFNLFGRHFGFGEAVDTVGHWVHL